MMLRSMPVDFTNHARQRMAQRRIRRRDVMDIIRIGERRRKGDTVIYSMPEPRRGEFISRRHYDLLGIHVVCSEDERCVITVFRDDRTRESFSVLRELASSPPGFTLGELLGGILEAGVDSAGGE